MDIFQVSQSFIRWKTYLYPCLLPCGTSATLINRCTWFPVTQMEFSCLIQGHDPTLIFISKRTLSNEAWLLGFFSHLIRETSQESKTRKKSLRLRIFKEYLYEFFVWTTHFNPNTRSNTLYVVTVLQDLLLAVLGYSRYRNFHFSFLEVKFVLSLCSSTEILKQNWEKRLQQTMYLTAGWGKSQGEDSDKWLISDLTSQTFKDTIKYRCSIVLSLWWHNLYIK